MAQAKALKSDEIKTPLFIAAYPALIEPEPSMSDESKLEYCVTMLFPKATTDLSTLRTVIANLAKQAFGPDVKPEYLQLPIHDGDMPNTKGETPEYKQGHWVMRAKSNYNPVVYGPDNKRITQQAMLAPGNLMRAIVQFYTYDNKKRGISATLLAAFKAGDGEPLAIGGGQRDYSSQFAEDVKAPVANNYGF